MAESTIKSGDYSTIQWTSLSITHVEYPQGEWFGKILAITSLLPLVIIIAFTTLIIFRRDLHTISYFLGILLNEAINFILKHLIKELRPCKGREILHTEYGMPSSHSQFMWFFSMYLSFFVLIRLHHGSSSFSLESLWKYLVTLGGFVAASLVSYSRVYLQYHTSMQVICGAMLGVVFAVVWFTITQFFLTPLYPVITSWPICELLMIRDSTLIPNVMWFEYTSHRTESRTRQRKLASMKAQ
ncbi:dolichyldiphosphatase 1-like [Centruroides sculpturatus]|uniref:dolichyldiphosphatase 1-like n=2 Tax=Centruroides sculpturatus TaxID=218467 RepID=UPI000C6D47F5|nr:dolichyldiphosphatase 1-like [Centruroides sculpturatus]